MARLEDICSINMGQSPESSSYNENGEGMPFFQGNADFGELHPKVRIWCNAPTKIAECGDILISVRAPIGALNIADKQCCIGRGLAALTVNETLCSPKYLWYGLECKVDELNSKGTGSTFKAINKKTLAETEIPLPPLEEQRRIAALLNKVSDLIAKRRAQLDKLDLLVKARFAEMFGKTQYPHTALIKLIVEGAGLSYGIVVPGDNVKDGVPMIRPSDFKNDNLYLEDVYRVAPEIEAKYARTRLIGDEILVQVIGQPGQVMLADIRCKGMNVTRNLAVIRPNCNRINRIYLKIYMQTQEAQAFMLGETKQSTLKQLPLSRLKELEIPVPSMALQEQFAAFVEQTEKSKLTIQRSLDKLETLKKALMQQYFG